MTARRAETVLTQHSSGGLLLFALAIFAGIYLTRDNGLSRQAPGFSLPETYGGQVDLESFHGRPVLLAFWTTSCGICRRELPVLSRLAPDFRSRGIEIIAIHLGSGGEAREYMRSNHIDLTSLVDTGGAVGRAYHVSGVPALVLIGSDGTIKRRSAGMADESVLAKWMDAVSGS